MTSTFLKKRIGSLEILILVLFGSLAVVIIISALAVAFAITLVPGFEEEFSEATDKTGLNFLIVEYEDLSVTLYAWNNETNSVGPDGFPDRITPLAGYANELALYGPNGVEDVLDKVPM